MKNLIVRALLPMALLMTPFCGAWASLYYELDANNRPILHLPWTEDMGLRRCSQTAQNVPGYSHSAGAYDEWALDFVGGHGTVLTAPAEGTIYFHAGTTGYGNKVHIQIDDEYYVVLAHLSEFYNGPSWDLYDGDRVGVGQAIGEEGSTGNSTGSHVHVHLARGDASDPHTKRSVEASWVSGSSGTVTGEDHFSCGPPGVGSLYDSNMVAFPDLYCEDNDSSTSCPFGFGIGGSLTSGGPDGNVKRVLARVDGQGSSYSDEITAYAGQKITIYTKVENRGDADTDSGMDIEYFIRDEKDFENDEDDEVGEDDNIGSLDPGESHTDHKRHIDVPSTPGTYYVYVCVEDMTSDGSDDGKPSNDCSSESNNEEYVVLNVVSLPAGDPFSPMSPTARKHFILDD